MRISDCSSDVCSSYLAAQIVSVLKILDGHRPIGVQLRIVVGFPAGIALLCLERGVIADRPVAGDFSVVGVFVVMPVQDSAVILAVSVMIGAMSTAAVVLVSGRLQPIEAGPRIGQHARVAAFNLITELSRSEEHTPELQPL